MGRGVSLIASLCNISPEVDLNFVIEYCLSKSLFQVYLQWYGYFFVLYRFSVLPINLEVTTSGASSKIFQVLKDLL